MNAGFLASPKRSDSEKSWEPDREPRDWFGAIFRYGRLKAEN